MTRLMLSCAWLCAMAFVAVAISPVRAAGFNNISYVSITGSDSHGCTTPTTDACITFNRALTQTVNYGEIDCVNSYVYSLPLTISQSVTIDCAGTVSGSLWSWVISGTGIVVRLRNLSFKNLLGEGGTVIDAQNMAALYIENCVITNSNFASPYLGIKFEPSAGESQLSVINSVISNNGSGGTGGGIEIAPTSGATASVTLDGVKILGNVYGIGLSSAGGTIAGALRHSTISGSNISGLVAVGGASPIFFTIDDSIVMNNSSYGIQSLGSGVNLKIGNSTITGNGTGVSGPGLVSFGNNQLGDNASNGTFTSTTALQ